MARRSAAAIKARGTRMAAKNFEKLPAKQRANMGAGVTSKTLNDPTQLKDKDDMKSHPDVGLKARRRR